MNITITDFTKLHPATKLWWQQRDLCRKCAHFNKQGDDPAMRCSADKHARITAWTNPKNAGMRYCIDARLPSRPCGPNGLLYQPKDHAQ